MHKIDSRNNTEIIATAALQQKKYREQKQRFLAEGLRTCLTLLSSPTMHLHTLYATQDGYNQLQTQRYTGQVTLVSQPVIEKLSSATTPSGIVGVFAIPASPSFTQLQSGIILAGLSDPGNTGTLIRSAAAFGLRSVVAIDGVDVWHPKVVQASAGTLGLVDIYTCSWQELIEKKPNNIKLCALVATGGVPLHTLQLQDPSLLVIGNEAHGIPTEWLHQCDQKSTIPMPGNTESLNAAVAGSIALYQLFIHN